MTDYIAAFFEILENKDKKLAQALKYRLSLEGNFMCILGYKISNDNNNLEDIIKKCNNFAAKDISTSSDSYCAAGIFALLKGETDRGKAYLYTAIRNLSVKSTAKILDIKDDSDNEALKYLVESRKTEYKNILEKADNLKEIINYTLDEFCKKYEPRKALREIELSRAIRTATLKEEVGKPKKSLN